MAAVSGLAFVVVWTAGMAVMMLPSASPLLRLDFATAGSRTRTVALGAGYLSTWVTVAAAVALLDVWIGMPVLDAHQHVAVAVALGLAAAYQASPLKRRCLKRCRSPLSRVLHGWRDGIGGAFRMGVENGLWCVGCCVGLVVALLVLGAMSIAWMALFFAVVTVEKTAPFGPALSRSLVVVLAIGAVAWAV